jgi:hypothetical protein
MNRERSGTHVFGKTTIEWLPGGFFLQQRIELNFMGMEVRGLEVIGYDPSTRKFPSTVYSNLVGGPHRLRIRRPGRWHHDQDGTRGRSNVHGILQQGRQHRVG